MVEKLPKLLWPVGEPSSESWRCKSLPDYFEQELRSPFQGGRAEDTRRDPHGSPKTTTEARDNFCDKKFRPKTMYLAKISAKDNVSGKKLISNETLVGTGTIFVARFSKNSGLKGSPKTFFVAKRLHKDDFCDILHMTLPRI